MCKWTTILLNALRYLWDTQNRLLAASSNGYVSTYLYDGEGQRTVKMSTPYEAVYTNSAEATVPSDTLRYTLYVGSFEIAYIAYIRN